MLTTFKRITKSGIKAFYRNGLLSASSILVTTITLLVILSIYLSSIVLEASIKQLENKVDINVYFNSEADSDKVLSLKSDLEKIEQVRTITHIDKEEVLKNFKDRNQDNKDILKALDIVLDNPFGDTLNIKAKQISEYGEISKSLESDTFAEKYGSHVENINYKQNKKSIEKLNIIINYTTLIGLSVAAILVFVALIVTFNTLRLIIYISKEEIHVMRLVGASKFFARGPFIIEGVIYGFVSAVLTLAIAWGGIYYSSPVLNEIFILNPNVYFSQNIFEIAGGLLVIGILIGVLSSYLAVRKYLNI